jgi:hypothetical protein
MTTTPARMRQIIGSTSDWAGNDLVIGSGEIAFERDASGILLGEKVGDGASRYSQLGYFSQPVSASRFGFSVNAPSAINKAALASALAASDYVSLPAGTFQVDPGGINVAGKSIRGAGIYRTTLQMPGVNTQGVIFTNGKDSTAAWGSGGTLELRDLAVMGNWDGSTALADQSWDATAALIKLGAAQGVRLVDVRVGNSFGHGLSCYRLGYATFTRVKDHTNRKDGMHLEAPSGADAITSTWIVECDFNSNRGAGNVYLKNGVGVFLLGNVFEDATAGLVLDGTDNRNVTLNFNHCETNTQGLLNFIGSGLKTAMCFNYSDTGITRSNPASQKLYAVGNVGVPNVCEDGDGAALGGSFIGDGTALNMPNNFLDFYGTANTNDVLGQMRFRSNNALNASVPAAAIRAVQLGNSNQNIGALELGTNNNSASVVTYSWRLSQGGNLYPLTDSTYTLGVAAVGRLANIYSIGLTLSPPASAVPANNGEMVVQLTSNTALAFKVKGSDGTVRTATLTLA